MQEEEFQDMAVILAWQKKLSAFAGHTTQTWKRRKGQQPSISVFVASSTEYDDLLHLT